MSELLDPAACALTAPETFTAVLHTTKGPVHVDVERALAPHGADRFYALVKAGFFTDVAFFRVVEGFMAQAGLHGDPAVNKVWRNARIPDDPVATSNVRGTVCFATSGKDARTTQFFINYRNNGRLDGMGFSPFGTVRDMGPVDALFAGYGDSPPGGRGPMQGRIVREGNAYLRADFGDLDYIERAEIA